MSDSSLIVRGPDSLPVAIPHLVGFDPVGSLVIIGRDAETHRVRVTVRVDLPPPDVQDRAVVEHWASALIPALLRAEAFEAIVAVLPDLEDDPWSGGTTRDLPRRLLVQALGEELVDAGIAVLDSVCIVGERLRSYLCTDPSCCPEQGRLCDPAESLRLEAGFVSRGSAPLPSRAALVAALVAREPHDPVLADVREARAAQALAEPEGAVVAVARFNSGLARWDAHPCDTGVLVDLVARVEPLVARVRPRDLLLRALTLDPDPDRLQAARQVLIEAVRCAEPELIAPLASVLAVCSWVSGDGAAAWVALDRAHDADPDYSLARLVATALEAGAPPSTWVMVMSELSEAAILGFDDSAQARSA